MKNCFAYLQLSNVLKEICSTPKLTIYSHYLKLRKKDCSMQTSFYIMIQSYNKNKNQIQIY